MSLESAGDRELVKAQRLALSPESLLSVREKINQARNGRTNRDAAKHLKVTLRRFNALLAALTDSPISKEDLADARIAAKILLIGAPARSDGRPPAVPDEQAPDVFVVGGGGVYHSMAACPALDHARPRKMNSGQAIAAGRTKCLRCKEHEERELLAPDPAANNLGRSKDRGSRPRRGGARQRRNR